MNVIGVIFSTIVTALLIAAPEAQVRSASSTTTAAGAEVVLITVDTKEAARKEMTRASWLLGNPIAFSTAFSIHARARQVRGAIAAHRSAHHKIALGIYVEGPVETDSLLKHAKEHYPAASTVSVEVAARRADPSDELDEDSRVAGLLVVTSSPSYRDALREAKRFSAASDIPYDTEGMIFDRRRGIIVPDDSDDEVLAGQYDNRREDGCPGPCVTVERSDAYPGLSPNLYIVVAGIVDQRADGDRRLTEVRKYAPDAYLKPTVLYMGCRH